MSKYQVFSKRGKSKTIEAKNMKSAIAKARRLGIAPFSIRRLSSSGKEYEAHYLN